MPFDPARLEAVRESEGFDPAKLEQVKKKAKAAPSAAPSIPSVPSDHVIINETPQTGMPSAGDFDFKTSAKQTGRYLYDNFIQGQIIPVAASIAATRLPAVATGTALKNVISPVVEGAYQGAAGYLADKANQALDISPPGEDQAIAQGGIQGAAAMLQKGYRILKPWSGRSGAVLGNEIADTEARQMASKYMPQQTAKDAFDEAAKEKAVVPLNETMSYVRGAIQQVLRHDPTATQANLATKLRQNYGAAGEHMIRLMEATKEGKPIPSDTWQWFHTQIGEDLGGMKKSGISTKGSGHLDQLYGRMLTDLERVAENETKARNTGVTNGTVYDFTSPKAQAEGIEGPTVPGIQPTGRGAVGPIAPPSPTSAEATLTQGLGATKLLGALQTYRREMSVNRLQKHVEDAMTLSRGQGADEQFNAAKVIRDLKKDRFFSKAFSHEEQKDIQDTLRILNEAPSLPPPASLVTGSRHVVERGVGALGGASIGGWMGAAAGFGLKDAADTVRNLSFAMSTKTGRALVRELAQSKGGFTNKRNASVIASYVTAMKNQPTDEGEE